MIKATQENQATSHEEMIEKCSVTLSKTVADAIRLLAVEKAEEQRKREPWNKKIKPNFSGTTDEILYRFLSNEGRIHYENELR